MSVTYDTPEEIALFRIRVLMGALKLETKGMTRRGRSVYAIVKESPISKLIYCNGSLSLKVTKQKY